MKQIEPAVLESIFAISHKLDKVQILGLGEPLSNRNFFGVVKKLKDVGVHLSFTTNGLLLGEDACNHLCHNEVDEIVISLQGAQRETHEKGKDSQLEPLLQNIKCIIATKQKFGVKQPRVSFNFVGLTNNISELASVVVLAHSLDVDQVYVANVVPYDQATCKFHLHKNPTYVHDHIGIAQKRADDLGVTLTVYASVSPHPMACRWSTRPHIGLNGDVYPCNFIGAQDSLQSIETIWYEDTSIQIDISSFQLGNLLNQNLEDIWNSQRAKELRGVPESTLEEDLTKSWGPKEYRELLSSHGGTPLTPYQLCRICPHRFKVTH